jgi:hypothetical protein
MGVVAAFAMGGWLGFAGIVVERCDFKTAFLLMSSYVMSLAQHLISPHCCGS